LHSSLAPLLLKETPVTRFFGLLLLACSMIAAPQSLLASPWSFQGLGDLPGGTFGSQANGVSADGSVVVGRGSSASGLEAFRWTRGGGMVGLGYLPRAGFSFISEGFGASADGSVIVGYSQGFNQEAFGWTSDDGMVGLGFLPVGSSSIGYAVSNNGAVIVGSSEGQAFRWTSDGGMVGLGRFPGGRNGSRAHGVSADGAVIVGGSDSASNSEAIRWTTDGGMIGLGYLPGPGIHSWAFGVSADGSVIVGESFSASGVEAFRWTVDGGMVGLGDLAGGYFDSHANSASGDGSVVVGQGNSGLGPEAFHWSESGGMVSLKGLLTSQGVDLTGWTLTEATGISDNGQTIVGYGINPNGQYEAWIATTVPEPSSWALAMSALIGGAVAVAGRRRKARAPSRNAQPV
jgi:probable HAF family extracellular repeat protein